LAYPEIIQVDYYFVYQNRQCSKYLPLLWRIHGKNPN
jgi:hypothetical protein